MNFLEILYNIIIAPLEMIIETVFCVWLTKIELFGAVGAIVAVSLAVGFLTLPIYNVADAIQKRERDIQHGMASGIKRIKDTFTGDERFMMMQTFYREHHWSPVYALRSSLSIIIEVPFFIAAYHFLSHYPALQGVSCGILHDLGKPDGLIAINAGGGGSIHPLLTQWALNHRINLLPILMTAINAVSSAVYLKGFSVREKAQTYGLALIFLVLLYNSPSGLVLYWTLNNLFSLAKNAVQRWVKHPGLVAHGAISAVMLAAIGYMLAALDDQSPKKRLVVLAGVIVFAAAPYVVRAWRKGWFRYIFAGSTAESKTATFRYTSLLNDPDNHRSLSAPVGRVSKRPLRRQVEIALFLTSACGLALLCGLVLPSSVIATDVMEFSFVGGTDNPAYYVARSLCVFTGLFVIWPLVVYNMFGVKIKGALSLLFPFAFVMALLNVYAFCYDYGRMDVFFKFDNRYLLENYSAFYSVLPILVAALVAGVLCIAVKHNGTKHIAAFLAAFCIAEVALSAIKVHSISTDYKDCAAEHNKNKAISTRGGIKSVYHLSRTDRNVVVLFSDAAINSFFPYIVKQFPELKEQFSGFVYYPNTVSFGSGTIKAIDAMSGGYEYTPEAMDKRSDELILDKYNEATSVMPKLFLDAGYSVTIGEPQDKYSVYNNDSYKRFDGVKAYYLENKLGTPYMIERGDTYKSLAGLPDAIIKKHILGFCFMQSVMPVLRETLYNDSWYYQTRFTNDIT